MKKIIVFLFLVSTVFVWSQQDSFVLFEKVQINSDGSYELLNGSTLPEGAKSFWDEVSLQYQNNLAIAKQRIRILRENKNQMQEQIKAFKTNEGRTHYVKMKIRKSFRPGLYQLDASSIVANITPELQGHTEFLLVPIIK